ncbi:MAG: LysR family transcriptional regulator [Methylobacterium sp.]|nr:LysR family transcriptional regulator [Methylobacterium sp.]
MAITLKQIEAFHSVIVTGTVTRAADKLGVSQPAVSRMIADLESSVGFPLFVRSARQLVPTVRARTLHAQVERSFLGLQHIEATADALRQNGEGQLRLGVVPSLLPTISRDLIAPFVRLHPLASISIEVVATLNTLDWLSFRQTDIGITFEAMSHAGLETRMIGQTEAVCIVSSRHPLTRLGRAVEPRDLSGATFVSYMPDSGFRAEIDHVLAAAQVRPDSRIEVRTTAAACELVAALGAVTLVPSPSPQLAADNRIVMLPFRPSLINDVVLVQSVGPGRSPLAQAFVEFAAQRSINFLERTPI